MPFRRTSIDSNQRTGFYPPKRSRVVGSRVVGYDSDALVYINAVEAADGQALEGSIKDAYNTFVVGCKSDGIWNAIKASCIMAGARTLSGALVPLVGAAPTNNNFVAGDYDRKTGLLGDGSTKYLDSNRNNNADPQNNHHVSVRCTRNSSTNEQVLAGARTAGSDTGGRWLGFRRSAATPSNTANYASMPDTDTNQSGGVVSVGSTVFTGFSRSASSGYTSRVNNSNTSQTQTSTVAVSANLFISALNNGGTAAVHSDARITFYSIGESLDLALLDARVDRLINDIVFFLNTGLSPTAYDIDTLKYVNRGYAAGGSLS